MHKMIKIWFIKDLEHKIAFKFIRDILIKKLIKNQLFMVY
jgi:hypothetical protein